MQPFTGYRTIKVRTNKGGLTQEYKAHQTVQMDEIAGIILENNIPIVRIDGKEGLNGLRIIDAI